MTRILLWFTLNEVAAVPDTNIILSWTIPSELIDPEYKEGYRATERYMDSKVEKWDVYISPTVNREFGKHLVDQRAREQADYSKGSWNEIMKEIERGTSDKLEEVNQQVYFLTEEESETEKVDNEAELITTFQQVFPTMEREEKRGFYYKSLLPGMKDFEYLVEAEEIAPEDEEEQNIYEEVYIISGDRHITTPSIVSLLSDFGLKVITMEQILERNQAETELKR